MSLFRNPGYREAVALNNIGVELLQMACYEQALDTLADATTAMKNTLRGLTCDDRAAKPDFQSIIGAMLKRAQKQGVLAPTLT